MLSCVDGGLFGTGSAVSIGFAPSFQILDSDFGAGPVDQIRATAYEVETSDVVGTFDEEVDPTADQWDLALAIDMDGRSAMDVIVELELLSDGVVVWSARTEVLSATSGGSPEVQQVTVFRGPLGNLEVTGVSVIEPPTRILQGETATATVEIEVAEGSTVVPTPFWASLDPTVATVAIVESDAVITAVGAGTTSIVVAAGPETDEFEIEVVPRVQSVVVTPATAVASGLGVQLPYAAVVTDGFGQVTTSEPVLWSTGDGNIATVDASGVVTTVGFGTTEVRATAGGVTGAASVTVDGILGVDLVWLGTLSDDWIVPGNWSTGLVPTALDNVLIRAGGTLPRLTVAAQVADLTVETEASLTLADQSGLIIGGDLTVEPFAAIESEGDALLQMTGAGATIEGEVNAQILVSGAVTLAGNVLTEGTVSVSGAGARLDISDFQMLVSGDFTTVGDGVLEMTGSAASALVVDGDIGFVGGSTEGLLTSGVIRARGDFAAGGQVTTSFAPTGLHSVIFEGTATQTIGFSSPGADAQRFATVWFNSEGTTTASTDFVATTELWLFQNAVDAGSGRIYVGGRLRDVVGGLNYGELHFISDVDDVPSSLPGTVFIDAVVNWPESSTIDGDLVIDAALDLGEFSLTVNGDVSLNGDLTIGPLATMSGLITIFLGSGSTLDIDGELTAEICQNEGGIISGLGLHPCALGFLRTWIGGSDLGSTAWFVDANWLPFGIPTSEDDVLIPLTSFNPVSAGSSFEVSGLTVEAGVTLDLVGDDHTARGDVVIEGQLVNGGLSLESTLGSVVSGSVSGLGVSEDRSLDGQLDVDGDLFVFSNTLSIGPETLNVTGDLRLESGAGTAALRMDDSDGQVQIDGELNIQGASLEGLLTAGTLRVRGDVFGDGSLFVATGSHVTEFNGPGPQDVDIGVSGATGARFFDVVVEEGSDVSFLTDTHVANDLDVRGELTVDAAATLDLAGTLVLQAGSVLNIDGDITASGGCINLGATILGLGLNPCLGGFDFTWLGGDAAGATLWENANNWIPNGVPTAASTVLVAAATDVPVLAGDASVASLVVEAGMGLDLGGFDLDVVEDLEALGTITNGQVTLSGAAGTLLEGSVDDLLVAANRTLTGPLIATGNVVLSDADLEIGDQIATVAGDFELTGLNAHLRMLDAAGELQVAGTATFDGGSHINQLLEGTLSVGGDFLALGAANNAFTAQANHLVVFDGTAGQEVMFTTPGTALQRFANVRFEGTGSAFVTSDVFVSGVIEVANGTSVDATDFTVSVGGGYIDPANGLLLNQLDVTGDLTTLPATLTTALNVNATLNLPGNLTLVGDLTLNNNDLIVGANGLDVSGDLMVTGASAQFVMTDAASNVSIGGDVTFDGGSHVNQLTMGTLAVGGDFAATASSTTAFVGANSHTVVFDGTADQNVTFASPGQVEQRFNDVLFASSGLVTFASDIVATGRLEVLGGSAVEASDDIVSIGGSFIDGANGMTLQQLNVIGDLAAMPATVDADVDVQAILNLPNDVDVTGDVTVSGSRLLIGSNQLGVSGDLFVTGAGAQLVMLDVGSDVAVAGSVTFDGNSHINQLTDGTLSVGGDFSATASNGTSFVGQSGHTVVFDGGGVQNVSFSGPGTTLQRFANVRFEGGSQVALSSDMTATGDVLVESGTTVDAADDVVSIGGSLGGSLVDPAGGLTLQQLNVTGDLTAIPSLLAADVSVEATFNLPNAFSMTGDLTLNSNRLIIGTNQMDVNGDLVVTGSNGQLVMLEAASDVDVLGSATFDGGSHVNQLTNGTLRVAGDFTATASNVNAFVAQTAHETVLNGDGAQVVTFSNPGTTAERFFDLTVENVNGSTTFATDFVVSGTFSSDADASANGPTISVAGAYLAGGGTSMAEVVVFGDLSGISPSLTTDVTVTVAFNLPNDLSITGDVTVDAGRLIIGASQLGVTGDLLVTGVSGQLVMLDPASDVSILGNATFDGGSHVNQLTNGFLRVGGDFTTTASNVNAFVAQTSHTTVLNGDATQTVTFSNAGTTSERFYNLAVINVNGSTTFATDLVVSGAFSSDADASVSGPTISVAGSYDAGGGTSMADVVVFGDLTSITQFLTTDVTVTSTFNLPNPLSLTGALTVDGGRLVVGPNTLDVSGDLTVTGGVGQLAMLDAGSDVDVLGNATFDGGSHVNQLTNGTLRVGGDFSATATNVNSFVAQTAHTTVMNGTADQSISFSGPATTAQRFHSLELSNFGGDITFLTDVVALGDFSVFAGVNVDAADDVLSVGGSYEDGSDGIQIQELVVVGNLTSHSGGLNGDLTVDATWNLTDDFYVAGDVAVNSSRLILDGNSIIVDGNFDVTGNGQLVMQNPADALDVVGNATFAGGSHVNQLTEGTLSVMGNFTASGSPTAFVGQSNHTVDFIDPQLTGVPRTVTFDNPGASTQRFANLGVTYPAPPLNMASSVVVMGTFELDEVASPITRTGPVGSVLDLRGTVNIVEMSVVGMPIRVESSVAPGSHTIDNIEFTNMDPTETQLYIALPGASVLFASLTASGIIFDEVLTTGKYVETASTNGQSWTLQMDSPSPGSVNPLLDLIVGLLSPIIWPWP